MKYEAKTMILFMGIQASGKTTFYHSLLEPLGYIHISLDILKTRHRERQLVLECILAQQSFVVDNTNPTKQERATYISTAKASGYRIIGMFFQSKLRECISRNELRDYRVPTLAIPNCFNRLEMPSFNEGFDELYFVSLADNKNFNINKWKE